ncbi:hypothetical protein Q5P01_025757 [Channa striata]|uniref:Uncharacterized protein n=1 Tax=Channa striata TaxID=64152 RepID=A0AA88INU8_CHASR|nr:hypothetical protein Q5P01_025757 [Channa striata]
MEFFFNSAAMTLHSTGVMSRTHQVRASMNRHKPPKSNLSSHRPTQYFYSASVKSIDGTFESASPLPPHHQVTDETAKAALRALQFFRQTSRLKDALSAELEVTEVPTIRIPQQSHGISHDGKKGVFVCVSEVSGGHEGGYQRKLSESSFKPSQLSHCHQNSDKRCPGFFDEGVLIPLPEGVGFTRGTIEYHDGVVVVGGDLSLDPRW